MKPGGRRDVACVEEMVSEEIDLRHYLGALLRAWFWILGAALLFGLAAYWFANRMPPTYRATALLAVAQLRYEAKFDPKLPTVTDDKVVYRAYPEIAVSDDVLQQVRAGLSREVSLADLRGRLQAESGADLSLVRLSATAAGPDEAAEMANVWATVFIQHINRLYAGQDSAAVAFFEAQLAQEQTELARHDQALVDFAAVDQGGLLTGELNARLLTQGQLLSEQQALAAILRDLAGVRQQLTALSAGDNPSAQEALAALLLQVRAVSGAATLPVTLQLAGAGIEQRSTAQQLAFLDSLAATLATRSAELDTLLADLKPTILDLQRRLQEATATKERLTDSRDVAREAVLTLARKVAEVRLASQEPGIELQVASHAATPEHAIGPRPLLLAAPAAALGALAALVLISIRAYRRGDLRVAIPPAPRQREASA